MIMNDHGTLLNGVTNYLFLCKSFPKKHLVDNFIHMTAVLL